MSGVTLALTLVAVVGGCGRNSAPAPAPSATSFGINGPNLWWSDAQLTDNMAAIDRLGVQWVRLPAYWYQISEDGPTSFNWTLLDRLVDAAQQHHKKILMLLLTTPQWARPSGAPTGDAGNKYAPADPAAFAAFAAKVAARYGPRGVSDYEVWNEPNSPLFWKDSVAHPVADADHYSDLLKQSAQAIHTVEPAATVIVGGLSPATDANGWIAPTTFLARLYELGAGNYFEAVGYHPYSYPAPPGTLVVWNSWMRMSLGRYGSQAVPTLRGVMTDNGDSAKKVWLTEYGMPTAGSTRAVSEARQAADTSQAIAMFRSYHWAGPLFFYTLRDTGSYGDPKCANDIECYFGVQRAEGSDKPVFGVIADAARRGTSGTDGQTSQATHGPTG